jgi:hypothetical protein
MPVHRILRGQNGTARKNFGYSWKGGLVASDVASRDHYLTLALFSRRIIEALRELVRSGRRERLQSALPSAIESLQAATDSRKLSGYGLRVVRSYDQVRTINELFPRKQDRVGMIKTLQALQGDISLVAQKEAALKAIQFFYTIENRALRNYRHPSPRAARTRRGLCLTHQVT